MKKLITISLFLFAFAINAQSLQRIQEEENPVYKEVVDNSEFGINSVSYTHLDVYKRQFLTFSYLFLQLNFYFNYIFQLTAQIRSCSKAEPKAKKFQLLVHKQYFKS